MHPIQVSLPFTSANLGPGFDIFGLALTHRARFSFTFHNSPDTIIEDESGKRIFGNTPDNLVRSGFHSALLEAGITASQAPGFHARCSMAIPPGRGFGSSAVAYAAGVAAASEILAGQGRSLTIERELKLLSDLEGHPDNICTARLGGWNFFHADETGRIRAIRKTVPKEIGIVILYPNFSISTAESRQVLPESYSMRDILCNLRGVSLWFEFLQTGDFELLAEALKNDRLHEPHRIPKIPGFAQIKSLLLSAGATGVALSGSGPGMLALFPAAKKDQVLSALRGNSLSHEWVFETSEVDEKGLIVERG